MATCAAEDRNINLISRLSPSPEEESGVSHQGCLITDEQPESWTSSQFTVRQDDRHIGFGGTYVCFIADPMR